MAAWWTEAVTPYGHRALRAWCGRLGPITDHSITLCRARSVTKQIEFPGLFNRPLAPVFIWSWLDLTLVRVTI